MTDKAAPKSVLICDTQPIAIEGLRSLLANSTDMRFAGAVCNLDAALELAKALNPAVLMIDKALGTTAIMNWLHGLAAAKVTGAPVVWGAGINESEALRFLQAGARGILRRTTETENVLHCLRAVSAGNTWMEEGIFGSTGRVAQPRRSQLTPREGQVVELVEQGMRNRDIARRLGIQTGTVKIHLKHIFEKTGVRGRYGLALTGLREKGAIALPPM